MPGFGRTFCVDHTHTPSYCAIEGDAIKKKCSVDETGTHTTHFLSSGVVKCMVVSKHFSLRSITLGDVATVFSHARCSARYSLCGKPKM